MSLADIEGAIGAKHAFASQEATGAPSLATPSICILEMANGFNVVGTAAPASAENFNRELGRKFAYVGAVRQVWPLMGYVLRGKLAAEG